MRQRGRRSRAGRPHGGTAGGCGQGDHRHRQARRDGGHRHHRRGTGEQPRRADARGVRQGRRADQQRVPGAIHEALRQHHVRAHEGRHRTDGVRRSANDPGLHPRIGRIEGFRGQRELDGGSPLAGQVRRLQDGQVGAAGDVADVGDRARRAGNPGELRSAGLYLGRNAEELLRAPGRQVRHQCRRHLQRCRSGI